MVNCNSKYEYNICNVQNADEYNFCNVQKQSMTAEYGPSIENVDAHYHITATVLLAYYPYFYCYSIVTYFVVIFVIKVIFLGFPKSLMQKELNSAQMSWLYACFEELSPISFSPEQGKSEKLVSPSWQVANLETWTQVLERRHKAPDPRLPLSLISNCLPAFIYSYFCS